MDQTPPASPDPETHKVVELAPPVTTGGQKLTEAERLGIENIYLRMQNLQLQVQSFDNMKAQAVMQMQQLQKDMEELRTALSQKYGVNITQTTVTPDGTIVAPKTNGT